MRKGVKEIRLNIRKDQEITGGDPVDYSVMCPSCMHTISIESRFFEIAYPLDYENRIKIFLSNNCRKCGEKIDIKRTKARPRNPEAELFERQ